MALTFDEFQDVNAERCKQAFPTCSNWTVFEWALALCGEAGELANILKKVKRGDYTLEQARPLILKEFADCITYCDLGMTSMDAVTGYEVVSKFNEVSVRVGYEKSIVDSLRTIHGGSVISGLAERDA